MLEIKFNGLTAFFLVRATPVAIVFAIFRSRHLLLVANVAMNHCGRENLEIPSFDSKSLDMLIPAAKVCPRQKFVAKFWT